MQISDFVNALDGAGLVELGRAIAALPGDKKAHVLTPVTCEQSSGGAKYHLQMAVMQMLQEEDSSLTAGECIIRQRQMT